MALFFDLKKLEAEAAKTPYSYPYSFIKLLQYHYEGTKVVHSRQKIKPIKNLAGTSFLLNPAPIFNSSGVDIVFRMQYVQLAGRRDYALFRFHEVIYLDTTYFPDLDMEVVKRNPLLTITNKHIHFKYEEDYYGT
ncbi:hypothetical protein UFOVP273_25 [uncultured Caudovirales phage]|uniref:Uncharacterized protein n=1 Tax=uncultured Caudovirales phage TaxID=2100421 RepID=A0A6J5LMF3_9CAUD|nr:hypothetical protein UFOVP273_25 [uncultured Caudovirales phage]